MEIAQQDRVAGDRGLRGKRVLITGASSGIGRAAALLFAEAGAALALNGRDEDALSARGVWRRGGGGRGG